MDVFTASIAFATVQFCLGIVMAGLFITSPTEKCTCYWALTGVLVAVGVLMVTFNAGAPRYALLVIGNNSIIIGAILQWIGVRHFYKKQSSIFAWILGIGFFISYGILLFNNAALTTRVFLASAWILAILALSFYEMWVGQKRHGTLGSVIALTSLCLLIACYIARVVGALHQIPSFNPHTAALPGVLLIFLGPMAGGLLLFCGLLLLYFERVVQEKNHLATHDSLTGLLNRRAIDGAGERELDVATRLNHSLGVAFVDIDHFKRINDNFGHEAGDRVIAEISQILKQNCRNIDLIGRHGGDEFCLILPGVDPDTIAAIGERLVNAVREHQAHAQVPTTISVGLALWTREAGNESWQSLLRRADSALYGAKAEGRDRFSARSPIAQVLQLPPAICT